MPVQVGSFRNALFMNEFVKNAKLITAIKLAKPKITHLNNKQESILIG